MMDDKAASHSYRFPNTKVYGWLFFLNFVFAWSLFPQVTTVEGNVTVASIPQKYVKVTFTDRADTSRHFESVTDANGHFQLDLVTGVVTDKPVPRSFKLGQNYPNPFSNATSIPYSLNQQSDASLTVYDVLGRRIAVLSAGLQLNGYHETRWDGKDMRGMNVPSGTYFYRLKVKGQSLTGKMILVRGAIRLPISPAVKTGRIMENQIAPKISRSATTTLYTVAIRNTDSTATKISPREFYNVPIEGDTTLNFAVTGITHYNSSLYLCGGGYDRIYVVDTDSDAVIDTLTGFGSIGKIAPLKGGSKVYVMTRTSPHNGQGVLYAWTRETRQIKPVLNKSADIWIRPDGIPLLIVSTPYDSIRQIAWIDTISDAVTVTDSIDIMDAWFYQSVVFGSNDSTLFAWTNQNKLFQYNYYSKEILRQYTSVEFPSINIFKSPRGDRIYVAGGPCIQVSNDSIVGWLPGNNIGSIAVSSEGNRVYLTDPGNPSNMNIMPSGEVTVFDSSLNMPISSIDINVASGLAYTMTDQILIMPDGEKAYVTDRYADVFVIDLTRNQVSNVIRFVPHNIMLSSMAIAPD